jgi:type IX secretion system PorP/SprF family membrane protein
MKRLLPLSILFFCCVNLKAQQQFPHFTQTFSNPYLINPSLITLENSAEANVSYRQQWAKVPEAPSSLQFDVQYQLDPKISIAANFYNDRSILLSQNSALGTFAYKVFLAPSHSLGFGLSAGVVFNRLNLRNVPDVDLSDPVLTGSGDNTNFTGQFGANYQFKRWIIGFSLMDLIENTPFTTEGITETTKNFSPLRDQAVFMSTILKVSPSFSVQPMALYRSTNTDTQFLEGNLLINYKGIVDIGGGYRTDFGPHLLLRVKISKIRVGYAYQLQTSDANSAFGATNEFQAKFLFKDISQVSNQKKTSTPSPKDDHSEHKKDTVTTARQPHITDTLTRKEHIPVSEKEATDNLSPLPGKNEISAPQEPEQRQPAPQESNQEPHEQTVEPGNNFYLVVGAFFSEQRANKFLNNVQALGYAAEAVKEGRLMYIRLLEYTTPDPRSEEARKVVNDFRSDTEFKDAWFKRF